MLSASSQSLAVSCPSPKCFARLVAACCGVLFWVYLFLFIFFRGVASTLSSCDIWAAPSVFVKWIGRLSFSDQFQEIVSAKWHLSCQGRWRFERQVHPLNQQPFSTFCSLPKQLVSVPSAGTWTGKLDSLQNQQVLLLLFFLFLFFFVWGGDSATTSLSDLESAALETGDFLVQFALRLHSVIAYLNITVHLRFLFFFLSKK